MAEEAAKAAAAAEEEEALPRAKKMMGTKTGTATMPSLLFAPRYCIYVKLPT